MTRLLASSSLEAAQNLQGTSSGTKLTGLPIARYQFTAQIQEDIWLPEYAGSLFRGQFGAALRRLSCMTRQLECAGCPLLETCPYTQIFQPVPPTEHPIQNFSAIPAGYIIVPPMPKAGYSQRRRGRQFLAAGDFFEFEMVLVGHVRHQLPLIIYAWQQALSRGLTKDRKAAILQDVRCVNSGHNHQVTGANAELNKFAADQKNCVHQAKYTLSEFIWTSDTQSVQPHDNELALPAPTQINAGVRASDVAVSLIIDTPLRLQRKGRVVGPDNLDTRTFLAALARRVALIMEFHADDPHWGKQVPQLIEMSEQKVDSKADLRWFDWRRYSSRQRQEMALGGVVGHIQLKAQHETMARLWPWVWIGQWLHVGKNATFGMGQYRIGEML